MKNKISTALLALFLGYLGAHQFYLNRIKKGYYYFFSSVFICVLFYLKTKISSLDNSYFDLFTKVLLTFFLLILVIDFIAFLIIDDKTFYEKYNDYASNTYFKEIQIEIDRYYEYVKATDLRYIINTDGFVEGSYNYLLKQLIEVYTIVTNSHPDDIRLHMGKFRELEKQLNKLNEEWNNPKINYFGSTNLTSSKS